MILLAFNTKVLLRVELVLELKLKLPKYLQENFDVDRQCFDRWNSTLSAWFLMAKSQRATSLCWM